MMHLPTDAKVEKFFTELSREFPSEAVQLRQLVARASSLGLRPQTGKNESNLHLKNAEGVNFGCFMSKGRFRNFASRLTGEKYLNDLGRVLGFRVSKEGSDHWWTVCEEGTKSIPLNDFLEFESEWFHLVAEWIRKSP